MTRQQPTRYSRAWELAVWARECLNAAKHTDQWRFGPLRDVGPDHRAGARERLEVAHECVMQGDPEWHRMQDHHIGPRLHIS